MRTRIITRCIALIIIFGAIICFIGEVSAKDDGNATSKKKKIYISTIKANGINSKFAGRVKEGIRLAIFEGFGSEYQVIDDDAIKVMYKQAEAILSSGCDDTSCMTQIADGINADIIIYGEVSQDGTKININVTSLERKELTFETRSIARISILESQVDWAASEIAKKLINSGYKIDMKNAPEKYDEVKLAQVEVREVKGLEISVIQFKSEDETVSKIIEYSKSLVEEGDAFFNNKDYVQARKKYSEVVERVQTKLSDNKRKQVQGYVDGIRKRISATVVMEYKPLVEKIDVYTKGIQDADEDDFENAFSQYTELENEIKSIPYIESDCQILSAINDRKDGIIIAIISGYEKRGDAYYRDYNFSESITLYKKGREKSAGLLNNDLKDKNIKKFDIKIETTIKTGRGFLINRVKSLVDQAEYYNFQDKNSDTKKMMKEARRLITDDMRIFVTPAVVDIYNNYAGVIGYDPISGTSDTEISESESKKSEDFEISAGFSIIPSANWYIDGYNKLDYTMEAENFTNYNMNFLFNKIGLMTGISVTINDIIKGKVGRISGYMSYNNFCIKVTHETLTGKAEWTGGITTGMESEFNYKNKYDGIDFQYFMGPLGLGIGYGILTIPLELRIENYTETKLNGVYDPEYKFHCIWLEEVIDGLSDMTRHEQGGCIGFNPYGKMDFKVGWGIGKISDDASYYSEALNPGYSMSAGSTFCLISKVDLSLGICWGPAFAEGKLVFALGYNLNFFGAWGNETLDAGKYEMNYAANIFAMSHGVEFRAYMVW